MEKIQEMIKRYDASKDNQLYHEIVERLKTKEIVWASYMPYTNNYYLDFEDGKPSCYLFTERSYYEDYQDYMLQQQILVKPEENRVEDRLLLFGELYRSGFELVVIDNGQTFLIMSLFDLIEKPDFSEIPEINRPIMNPGLVCAANYFFQGLATNRANKEMETAMFKEIYQAKYLMPFDTSKMSLDKTDSDNGEVIVKENSLLQFPLISNAKGRHFYPFFSDWNEFRRFDKEQKYSGNIIGFEDMKYFVEKADGITINPYGANIILSMDLLNMIESVANGTGSNTVVKEEALEKDTKVLLGDPANYPQEMINEVSKYLKSNKNVNAAYLRLMIKNEEQSYLIIVDFIGDQKEIFQGIANAGVPHLTNMFLDIIPLSTFGKDAIRNVKPFYKKKLFGLIG